MPQKAPTWLASILFVLVVYLADIAGPFSVHLFRTNIPFIWDVTVLFGFLLFLVVWFVHGRVSTKYTRRVCMFACLCWTILGNISTYYLVVEKLT